MSNNFELPPASAESDPNYDGAEAAPNSHIVVRENGKERELLVILKPGTREPFHHHLLPSKMIVLRSVPLRYYLADGSSFDISAKDVSPENPLVEELDPETLHSVKNLSLTEAYVAIRIEYL